MIWLVILSVLLIIFLWLLLAPMELFVDTRMTTAHFRWKGIGYAKIIREKDEWWLRIRILFFSKRWRLVELIRRKPAKRETGRKNKTGKKRKKITPVKILYLLTTFRVIEWEVVLDTGDNVLNAWLYPFSFLPRVRQHLLVNFTGENYVAITVRNRAVRIIYAWLNY